MKTVLIGPRPPELEALIEHRRRHGLDLFDELWEGTLHMVPAVHASHGMVAHELAVALRVPARHAGLRGTGPFNIGQTNNYRVPDGGYHRVNPDSVWVSTAALVFEVLSPDDETFAKFGFYFDHGVEELVVADPAHRSVQWFIRGTDGFEPAERGPLLGLAAVEVASAIDWP
ncbi:MAG: Uma2 family endonuclease [Acidimicrobiales bacterium]